MDSRQCALRLKLLRKILWTFVGVAALAFAWLLFWTDYRATERDPAFRAAFELTDHTGMFRTQEDFAGRWMLVFFGFANCPDVCPTTLAEIAAVMEWLGQDADRVQPIFISIDPERDTPKVLAEFIPRFEAGIVGLTGTTEQIEQTAKGFYIFYEEIAEVSAPDGYTMGHSSQLFLFNPTGNYVKAWQYGTPAEQIFGELKEIVAE